MIGAENTFGLIIEMAQRIPYTERVWNLWSF